MTTADEYDLVKILNDPEDYYPGNFETAEKAAAFLMCLCQEAADKIQKLNTKTAPKPMTEKEIMEQAKAAGFDAIATMDFAIGVRFAERHHGIGGKE